MEIQVVGGTPVQLDSSLFAREYNEALIHQVVTAFLAGSRAGTRAQKSRADVRGSGAKPWRQKGTGRARVGTAQNPIWRGGGVTFAARPQDWSQKVNRKMYRAAMLNILSELIRSERLVVVEELTMAEPKTKQFVAKLEELGVAGNKVLVVTEAVDYNLFLSARNVPNVYTIEASIVDPASLVGAEKVVMTKPALESIKECLA
ncbi:50S ribosomal protein L4 [Ignatzschineria sp. RMDPL8A]|uniref:50S ribosomal protein L4 n=1 Tax=Ignatzschineria sp. RMDPL8A TaxID=2999236 RepID=UPI0016A56486|nr:50S ribosomal protein L4 [Ignatzschineria sp. RMDPL8A]MDG9729491.1 50S ribosomal protein L4 [Ignatzschineria sp. RMDPL8A]NLD07989.1 50S ribosomal protein L4 [Xanthomonadaceae bacterium]